MLHMPNVERSSHVSQRDFLGLKKFCWIQEDHRELKSSSVALPHVVLFGQGGRQITDCSCWHQASAEATDGCSRSSLPTVVGLQLIQRTVQEQMS